MTKTVMLKIYFQAKSVMSASYKMEVSMKRFSKLLNHLRRGIMERAGRCQNFF